MERPLTKRMSGIFLITYSKTSAINGHDNWPTMGTDVEQRSPTMTLAEFLWSRAPAARARRRFWTRLLAVFLWAGVWMTLAAMFEGTRFVMVLSMLVGISSTIALGAWWTFREHCPRCGWNLNLTPNKPYIRRAGSVPSSCPNCGLDLMVEYPVA